MLQQTVVTAVPTFFIRFMKKFPTIARLASGEEQAVLRVWEGLGYYSRARNLHRAAKIVVAKFAGNLPSEYQDLCSLPGIGDYTASAIMSIAFNRPYPVVDANVRRVVGRLLGIESRAQVNTPEIKAFVAAAISPRRPGIFNEALMELGQTVCRLKNPRCAECPLSSDCAAFTVGTIGSPGKFASPTLTHLSSWQLIIVQRGAVLLEQRASGRFRGLWIFPRFVRNDQTPLPALLRRELGIRGAIMKILGSAVHRYTRFAEELTPTIVWPSSQPSKLIPAMTWQDVAKVDKVPMTSFDRRIWHEVERQIHRVRKTTARAAPQRSSRR